MSAHRFTNLRVRPPVQRNSRRVRASADSFLGRHGTVIARDIRAVAPVPMLDWAANLFSDVDPMADDEWMALYAYGTELRHDHAGVAS